jgi:hypothetical protein
VFKTVMDAMISYEEYRESTAGMKATSTGVFFDKLVNPMPPLRTKQDPKPL